MKILFITPGTYPVPAVKGGAVENLIEMLISSKEVTREKWNNSIYRIWLKNRIYKKNI